MNFVEQYTHLQHSYLNSLSASCGTLEVRCYHERFQVECDIYNVRILGVAQRQGRWYVLFATRHVQDRVTPLLLLSMARSSSLHTKSHPITVCRIRIVAMQSSWFSTTTRSPTCWSQSRWFVHERTYHIWESNYLLDVCVSNVPARAMSVNPNLHSLRRQWCARCHQYLQSCCTGLIKHHYSSLRPNAQTYKQELDPALYKISTLNTYVRAVKHSGELHLGSTR